MSVRRHLIAALSEDSLGGIVTLHDVAHAEQLVDAHRTENFTDGARLLEDAACDADWTRTPDYCAGLRAGAELLLANTGQEEATAAAATATPTDTNRRARLLNEMTFDGGRWKSGDVAAWYGTQGLTGLGANTARRDLATLRDSGAITQHDEKGVRFYTVSQKGSRT